MNNNPLVSVCTTFFNSERYIHRFLESCLHQTYDNIEVIILDDESTDNSRKVIQEYVARDSRVKYFRNDKRTGIAESIVKMYKLASGDLVVTVGADDWIARDYIESGVKSFLTYPNAAGIVPKIVSFSEIVDDVFTYTSETYFPSGEYSAEWFVKRMYRPIPLYVGAYAMIRKKDAVSAMGYFLKNYVHNRSESIPEELRRCLRMGYGTDSMIFLEILTRYKSFVFDESMAFIKISQSKSVQHGLSQGSLSEIFKDSYYYMLTFDHVYKFGWPKFYKDMKIFLGAEALSTAFLHSFRRRFHPSFLNIKESKRGILDFFGCFSIFEIGAVIAYSIVRVVTRSFGFVMRKFVKKYETKREQSLVLTSHYFLDSRGHFKV